MTRAGAGIAHDGGAVCASLHSQGEMTLLLLGVEWDWASASGPKGAKAVCLPVRGKVPRQGAIAQDHSSCLRVTPQPFEGAGALGGG